MSRCFLLCLIFTSCLVAGQLPKYALKGLQSKLKPGVTGQPDEILWKHDGNKVVEFNGMEQQVYGTYADRVTLDWHSAELDITDLRFEDSGEYELEAYVNKVLHRSHFQLEVMDKVAKPTISCEMNDGSSSDVSGVQATLMCSAEPRRPESLMTFKWRSGGNVHSGPKLTIPLGNEHDDEVHSCSVSNPLSNETATFTAKDCYPDNSAALIGSLVCIFILLLVLVGLGLIFCKLKRKACFSKDLEKQPPLTKSEGSDEKTAQGDENKPLLDRAPTLPSNQTLHHLVPVKERIKFFEGDDCGATSPKKKGRNADQHEETAPYPSSPCSESPLNLDLNDPTDDRGDADADELREAAEEKLPQFDPSESERLNEPDPAGVSGQFSEDTQSDKESFTDPEQPESNTGQHEKTAPPPSPPPLNLDLNEPTDDRGHSDAESERLNEPDPADVSGKFGEDTQSDPESSAAPEQPEVEKEPGQDEEADPASEETCPVVPPSLIEGSPDVAPEDSADEHEEESDSDQVSGETVEKTASPAVSSDVHQKLNESDDSTKEEPLSSVPEHKGSETSEHENDTKLSQEETHTGEDNQQETNKPVSVVENIPDSVSDEGKCTSTSQQPHSPTPTKADDRSTETFQHSPDAAHADSDGGEEEDKTRQDTDASEVQSHGSTAEADKGEGETVEDKNEVQGGPEEEKPGKDSLSGDKDGQRRDEVNG